jgi:hypothetical protein
MRKSLSFTTVLSLGLSIHFSVYAQDAASAAYTPNTSGNTQSALTNQGDQEQVAAWMIESAQVAKDYVDGLDQGQYAQSWSKGDPLFQHIITKEEWTKALTESRKRLGRVISRKLKDQRLAKDPHGLPKGAYMVVEYNTSFQNAPDSGELLTLRRGSDGKWRVLTYQVN